MKGQVNRNDDVRQEANVRESASVALRAFRNSGVGVGYTLLIYGIGIVVLLIAQLTKAAGAKSIVLVDRADEKVELAHRQC